MNFAQRNRRKLLLAVSVTIAAMLSACGGGVKTTSSGGGEGKYPTGNIEMSVGAAPGGSTDLSGRALAQGLSKELGVSVPVVNKPGANTALMAKALQSAKADGYKIAVQNASLFTITPMAVSPAEAISLDDFDLITGMHQDDYMLAVHADSSYKSIADLKKAGKNIKYATTGIGTGAQLAAALTFKVANIPATDIPFDGGSPAMTALLGKQVDVAVFQIGEGIENVKSGKLVPLAVFSPERIKYLPNVATAKEQGFDVVVSQYRFLTAPKGTPAEVKSTLLTAARKIFATDAYKKFNEANFLTPVEVAPDEMKKILSDATTKYKAQVDQYGIQLGGE